MRSEFRGYYRPTEAEFQELWSIGEVVVDANVLLNLYRYSMDTRNDLLKVMGQMKDRLWIPHQAAFEYQRNRIDVMVAERQAYSSILKVVDSSFNKVSTAFEGHSRHLILDVAKSQEVVDEAFGQIRSHIAQQEELHPDLPDGAAPGDDDKVRDHLDELFEGRVGPPLTDDELKELRVEGEKRYEQKIPPGYMDGGKSGERQWGDLIIWKQVILHAEKSQRPILFVTDERKEDWWLQARNQVVLPRPELVEEMKATADVLFYMYRSSTFMRRAAGLFGDEVNAEAVREVEGIADRHAKMQASLERHRSDLVGQRDAVLADFHVAQRRLHRKIAESEGDGGSEQLHFRDTRGLLDGRIATAEARLADLLSRRDSLSEDAGQVAIAEIAALQAELGQLFSDRHSVLSKSEDRRRAQARREVIRQEHLLERHARELSRLEAEIADLDRLVGED